jgi:Cu2+-containing amine oxidase
MPVLRHYSQAYKFYGAVPGAQLIVRMISTVYNYDYIQDLVLGIDGTIDVKVTTSGYIQATAFRSFYPQHYGFPVFTNVTGAWQRLKGNLSITV